MREFITTTHDPGHRAARFGNAPRAPLPRHAPRRNAPRPERLLLTWVLDAGRLRSFWRLVPADEPASPRLTEDDDDSSWQQRGQPRRPARQAQSHSPPSLRHASSQKRGCAPRSATNVGRPSSAVRPSGSMRIRYRTPFPTSSTVTCDSGNAFAPPLGAGDNISPSVVIR